MQDIADKVGVSKALVSLVFRNAAGASAETRKRVLDAADELGYRVNRTAALMTAKRSHLIGVMANIGSGFHAEIVEDLVAAADRAGYEIVLGAVTPTHGEPRVIDTLRDFRCEGLLLIGPELPTDDLASLGAMLPTVVIGRRISEPTPGRRPLCRWPGHRRSRRPPGGPGTPRHRPHRRRDGHDQRRPPQWLPARDAPARTRAHMPAF